ncbi:hypothetical protein ICP22011A_0038 [Vibrio phage ICP2_2011_A]|uniref:Uncharacterized protein n=1 Tax=Vibrio phage ICP2_2011_A TaxID=1529057 RepID=A0A076G6G2_9CAUD|nr:hypothetical protein ICP22011A_0038 [Vibrio phage ICP2_2011_A]
MKYYIESRLTHYPSIFPTVAAVLEHLFAVLGNGEDMNNKGYIRGNYQCGESYNFGEYNFGEPVPLTHIYSWSTTEEFQPFRKFAGCRDVGFKDAAQYFIDCVMLTPDEIEGVKPWKDNIDVVKSVLLNTPTITDEYESPDDTDKFLSKLDGAKITNEHGGCDLTKKQPNSVRKVWFFDVQWSDCPEFVEKEVRESWSDFSLGNDHYFWKTEVDEELFDRYPNIYFWLKHKGVPEGEQVLVHWWW